ncbi:hypothetical protein JTB14_005645 [Gonioctena quinquepunctata]|nr:hypothetical protein JTB14_005645 [Gonioctena quinquepunctata]
MIKENQIICCEDNDICSESDSNLEDKQVFETTLLELSLENETKTKYIQKIQHQNELFLDDVSLAEEEMNNTIKLHELKIKELNAHIEELKKKPTKTTTDKISTTNTGVQTEKTHKKCSSTNTEAILDISAADQIDYTGCPKTDDGNVITNRTQDVDKELKNVYKYKTQNDTPTTGAKSEKNTNQILIISDDLGKNVAPILRKRLSKSTFNISALVKPGARLHNVLENIEHLIKDFTLNDFVEIIAGSNDIDSRTTPSFSFICKKLRLCSNTNVIFSSVSFCKSYVKNNHIYKYNSCLNDFLCKFNKCVEGQTSYSEINEKWIHRRRINGTLIENVINIIKRPNQIKNLRFIKISDDDLQNMDATVTTVIDVCCSDITEDTRNKKDQNNFIRCSDKTEDIRNEEDENNFLYPRLSQLILQP